MSRIVEHNETVSAYPSSYDSTYQAYSVSGLEQGQTNSNSNNYATINMTKGNGAVTSIYYNFSFNIPTNAVISSVTAYAKCYISSTQQNRFTTRTVQLYAGTTAKGSSSTVSNSTTRFSMTSGTWTASELNNAKIRIYAVRGTNSTTTNYYFRFYGADITVNYSWDETFYAFTCTSSVQGAGMTSGETLSGGSFTATLTGISDISTVVIKDNGVDITSTFTKSGNNYVKSYSNVNADHTIVVEDASSSSKKSYVKKNNAFVESTNQYVKESNSWINRVIKKIYWKINGNWTETNDSMSGKTMFKNE